jgi:hypothetical protein
MTRRGRARPAIEPGACCVGVLLALSCAGGGGPGSEPAGDVGQSTRADACGLLERACCSAPRIACARGLWCDDATGVCLEGASGSPGAALLCQADADCAPARRCCSAGNLGTCQALEAGAACAQPDLSVLWSGEGATVEQEVFDGVTPSDGGCVREPGLRLRLRVSVAVANFGAADFILGGRDAPLSGPARARDEFLVYSLIDASGEAVVTGRGPLPCSDGRDPLQRFDCDFAGLAAGALMPARGLECEALDVTGLPAGPYRVRVALAHAWADADPSNDRLEMPVELPSFNPLDACPNVASPLLGSSFERECGWSPASAPGGGTCRPGERVSLDCGGCLGTPILRLCAGDDACRSRSALGFASVDCGKPDAELEGPCATVQGICPAGGRYSVLLGSEDPAAEASCTLAITPGF